ncbi:MAG: hypothetical protein HGB32_06340 [Geobacteraceae bacterium]|nr:hypothetical protein [Geobacteraceae bacterium]NTW79752.1 hypothetical protein [Geobacteraceae bacterium]
MPNNAILHNLTSPIKSQSSTLIMVCIYIFLVIERPWESVRYLEGWPIERVFAIVMIIVAYLNHRIKIVYSPTNKWVYGLLVMHFLLAPFAYNTGYAIDQGIEYGKMILLYMLMLSVIDDEESLKMLVKFFVFSMMFYVIHSLWEYHNGRQIYRMGISRMVGADIAANDPNTFGASVVLSLPFVYALLQAEINSWIRRLYYVYFSLAVLCVVLTGSRSSFVALIFLNLLWIFAQKGKRKLTIFVVAVLAVSVVWNVMPEEKQNRIRTLWDKEAGPSNAYTSADGRMKGVVAGLAMLNKAPLTGIGAGGKNFVDYRSIYLDGIPEQAHNLYAEVLGEFGYIGALLFVCYVVSILKCNVNNRKLILKRSFPNVLAGANIICVLILLNLGFAGHNFYRPLWLWVAAWSGGIAFISTRKETLTMEEDL